MSFLSARKKSGMTQAEVAEAVRVNQTSVHFWEVGKTKPRASLLPVLAKLYGCTVDELLKSEEK